MSRSILNHAPIGEYRRRFNLSEEVNCSCHNGGLETRAHILDQCPKYTRKRGAPARLEHKNYLEFLELQCMAGDFNCHSSVWDPRHEGNNHVATSLIDAASDLGVEVSVQPVRTPTHFPHARGLVPSVIDLMFLPQDRLVGLTHEVRTDWIGPSDHAPLCVTLPIRATEVASERLAMPKGSKEESLFLQALLTYIKSMDISNIDTRDALEDLIAGLARACNDAWNSNAKTVKVNTRSKAWWNADCATAMRQYRQSRSPADYGALRRATKAAKRQFFDERIETIATKNKRPWDLMNWTKQRNLPTYEAICYNEAPCNTMDWK
ncbi:hypothetical protein D9615_001761 [Tricholomella constricta]|uniref:Endonuclease/exonuclease/phosphatase domain-containing protein n=1 Tax=Tricholomella constricta TaxID=117010 RepID=A0A8H5HNA6_9AGAR|nr:hypothetical protein D9615_001761 [Tricholomella constricta]